MSEPLELNRDALGDFPLPPVNDGDKNDHGRLVIIAGSRQVPGAAMLSGMAALRSGAGKVRIATVASLAPDLALEMPEVLVVPLAEAEDGACSDEAVLEAARQAKAMDAVAAGPGMEPGDGATAIARALVESGTPTALDAGLLHSLRPLAQSCRTAGTTPILLPHSRELASLLDCSEEEVESDRLGAGRKAAEDYGAVVLAKGSHSYVVAPDGRSWSYHGGAPGLGVAGSGDVLCGIVGALLARGAEPLTALLWSVLLHGEAGEALSGKIGPIGFLARELPDELPRLLAR